MQKKFPFGRWNREPAHRVERIYEEPSAYWGECSCGWQSDITQDPARADADCEGHERDVFDRQQADQRFVRGRWE